MKLILKYVSDSMNIVLITDGFSVYDSEAGAVTPDGDGKKYPTRTLDINGHQPICLMENDRVYVMNSEGKTIDTIYGLSVDLA